MSTMRDTYRVFVKCQLTWVLHELMDSAALMSKGRLGEGTVRAWYETRWSMVRIMYSRLDLFKIRWCIKKRWSDVKPDTALPFVKGVKEV